MVSLTKIALYFNSDTCSLGTTSSVAGEGTERERTGTEAGMDFTHIRYNAVSDTKMILSAHKGFFPLSNVFFGVHNS